MLKDMLQIWHEDIIGKFIFCFIIGLISFLLFVFVFTPIYKATAPAPILERGIGQSSGQVGNVRMQTGLIFKTNEAKIIYGIDKTIEYSFKDKKIAKCLNSNIGKRVNITYKSYFLTPYSWGSTGLIISDCKKEQ